MNTWSLAGLIGGFLGAVGMFFRYFIMWPNTSEGLIWIGGGLVVMALSWVYDQIVNIKKTQEEDRLWAANKFTAYGDQMQYLTDKVKGKR